MSEGQKYYSVRRNPVRVRQRNDQGKCSSKAYPSEVGIGLRREVGFLVTRFVFLAAGAGSSSDSDARFRDPPAPASVLAGTEAVSHENGVGSSGSSM